jgi:hypothetical protein
MYSGLSELLTLFTKLYVAKAYRDYSLIKRENKIFLIYKKIQMGPYVRKGFLIDEEMRKYLTI